MSFKKFFIAHYCAIFMQIMGNFLNVVALISGFCRLSGSHMEMTWATFLLVFASKEVMCGGQPFHLYVFGLWSSTYPIVSYDSLG